MSTSLFTVQEHTLECQHIREYARAISTSQEDVLNLVIKQYTPLDNLEPSKGDVTIIAAHANGFPKELYEPLWDDLLVRSKSNSFRIRSIWIADVAQQGASGVLNENILGNDPSWLDHSRDLLHMINTFRSQMPMPIVGIGHSFGGAQLVNLSYMHPRLLRTIILLDPVIQAHASAPAGPSPAQSSTFRRDVWASRAEAEASFRKSNFYQTWDPRVLDLWCKYGIRSTPTALLPDEKGSVTLSTTKHQECFTFLRPSWNAMSEDGKMIINRTLIPDMSLRFPTKFPMYRPEPPVLLERLPTLRPSTCYIFGDASPMSAPEARKVKMDTTGTGVGGSGGARAERVKEVVLKGIGHLVAMEASVACADAAATWLGGELAMYEDEQKEYVGWTKKALAEKSTLSEEWQRRVGGPVRPRKSKI